MATSAVGVARGSVGAEEGVGRINFSIGRPDTGAMGVRTRELDIKAGASKFKADRAAREEAEGRSIAGIGRLAIGRELLWSSTIRAALLAGTPWLTEPAWHVALQILDP